MLGGFSVLSDVPQAALGNIRPAAVPSHGSDDNLTLGTLSCVFWKEWGCLKNLETKYVLRIFKHFAGYISLTFPLGQRKKKKKSSATFSRSLLKTRWETYRTLQTALLASDPLGSPQRVCVQENRLSFYWLLIRMTPRSTISFKPRQLFVLHTTTYRPQTEISEKYSCQVQTWWNCGTKTQVHMWPWAARGWGRVELTSRS